MQLLYLMQFTCPPAASTHTCGRVGQYRIDILYFCSPILASFSHTEITYETRGVSCL